MRIVNNMASLRMEEVGPLASTEEMLVAPEEVKRHEKGDVKGAEERTITDRARERRKKKVGFFRLFFLVIFLNCAIIFSFVYCYL